MKCPGQDTQYWKPGAIYDAKCPKCEKIVEFFKDDTTRKCSHCGHRFINPELDFGCASYCQFAEQCIGSTSRNGSRKFITVNMLFLISPP